MSCVQRERGKERGRDGEGETERERERKREREKERGREGESAGQLKKLIWYLTDQRLKPPQTWYLQAQKLSVLDSSLGGFVLPLGDRMCFLNKNI